MVYMSAVSINDKIYVIGGGPEPGLSVTNVNEIFNIREWVLNIAVN